MMTILNKFDLGEIVYLKTDPEQLQRIITGVQVCADGGMLYKVCQGINTDWHYEVEMSSEKNVVLSLS